MDRLTATSLALFAARTGSPICLFAAAFDLDYLDRAIVCGLVNVVRERSKVAGGVWLDDAVSVVGNLEDLWRNVLAELAGDAALFDPDLVDGFFSHGAISHNILGRMSSLGKGQRPSSRENTLIAAIRSRLGPAVDLPSRAGGVAGYAHRQ